MRPRTLPLAGYAEIEHVAIQRAGIPTDKELLERWKISRTYLHQLMRRARKQLVHKCKVSRETLSGDTAPAVLVTPK